MRRDKVALRDREKELAKVKDELWKLKADHKLISEKEHIHAWNLESKETLIKELRT